MKRKTLGLCTPRHHETKERWAAYPSAPKWDENGWWVCIAWCWCVTYFKMISWLDISVCLWVWMEHNICIQLQLDCINFYMKFHAIRTNMPMSLNEIEYMYIVTAKMHMTFYKALCLIVLRYRYFPKGLEMLVSLYSWVMMPLIFYLRHTHILVFPDGWWTCIRVWLSHLIHV
jgi:hypothetical protein